MISRLADRHYIFCLWTFSALRYSHFDFLTFTQCPAAFSLYCTVMYKNILAASLFDKTKSFLVIEPLDGAFYLLCHIALLIQMPLS